MTGNIPESKWIKATCCGLEYLRTGLHINVLITPDSTDKIINILPKTDSAPKEPPPIGPLIQSSPPSSATSMPIKTFKFNSSFKNLEESTKRIKGPKRPISGALIDGTLFKPISRAILPIDIEIIEPTINMAQYLNLIGFQCLIAEGSSRIEAPSIVAEWYKGSLTCCNPSLITGVFIPHITWADINASTGSSFLFFISNFIDLLVTKPGYSYRL